MRVLITGNYGLSLTIQSILMESNHTVLMMDKELNFYINNMRELTDGFDVFINCAYKDRIQTQLFTEIFNLWKMRKKTIINILTSALIFDGPNKKYIDDKRDLESKSFEVRTDDKEVRIINIYPNTLESSKNAPNQKLKFSDVASIVKFVIELPHDVEIFQIGISKTKLKIEHSVI